MAHSVSREWAQRRTLAYACSLESGEHAKALALSELNPPRTGRWSVRTVERTVTFAGQRAPVWISVVKHVPD